MAPIAPFSTARLPRIVFGAKTSQTIPGEVRALGKRALIVTGAKSFKATPHWQSLIDGLEAKGVDWEHLSVAGEPSPELVDGAVREHGGAGMDGGGIDVVVGIGGGSALDAAKAVAGLLVPGNSVIDHLEGVGPEMPYGGPSVPLIAVPTTAGTGSEATSNAVLSRHGQDGFKKSFRHDGLVARVAIVDPGLVASCPREVLAANGMDAFTQLLESFVSMRTNPVAEALALSGLEAFMLGFFEALEGKGDDRPAGLSNLCYASLTSGIVLAQTGLGSVHGLAQPLGSLFEIPHGVVCGTLVAEATDVNIQALENREPDNPALGKYARIGALAAGAPFDDEQKARAGLVKVLRKWTERLALPRLSEYGVTAADIERVAAGSRGSSMKTNPIRLTGGEVAQVVRRRL
ncbi:MAG: iron-containing alcohol dehydrogenase [Rhodospirillales bacterium]